MFKRSPSCASSLLLACFLTIPAVCLRGQDAGSAPVKKQLPADERAYKAARSINDPAQCLAAMRAFVKDYPKSSRIGRAQDAIFTLLLENFPGNTSEIDGQLKYLVKHSGKGSGHFQTETDLAYRLAEAGPSGVELPRAEKLAKDAVDHVQEAAFAQEMLASYAKFKIPPPKPVEVHGQFARTRAEALAVLADVYLRENKQAQGAALIAEAYTLDPMVDDVNTERGRLALLNHDDALALASFERAQLVGSMKAADREKMMQLYRQAHGGSDATFTADMDARYAQLYPPAFTPAKPAGVAPGHTVLLELFTGSGCPPCIGGDLAVEGVLEAYPRSEVVALAFDQHIPEPDPLTNPDSVARAEVYDIAHTPEYVIDGKVQPIYGSRREGSEDLYGKIAKAVDTAAAIPTNVQLSVSATNGSGGLVNAHATVVVPSGKDLEQLLAVKAEPAAASPGGKKPAAPVSTVPPAAAPVEPHLIVNFALVEDDVRYSGENGIRFHRMVVRSLAKPAGSGFSVEPAATVNLDASFDPAAISRSLVTYLEGYEQKNERFGKITFLTKDMTMQPDHLAVAAWVQDSVTHRVLQTAIIPVGTPRQGAQ